MALPVIICIQSEVNKKYLRYDNSNIAADRNRGLLVYSGESPLDPLARFEVVAAQSGDGLIHLKSLYTNKYLARWREQDLWIIPVADNPNENQSDWSCTLFKPEIIEDNGVTKKARLRHVHLGSYAACYWDPIILYNRSCLCIQPISRNLISSEEDIIVIISDGSAIQKLPRNVVFKGDNDKYLGVVSFDHRPYLQFSFENSEDPEIGHEVFDSNDGSVYFKSKYNDKFWRVDENDMIVADGVESGDMSNNIGVMFKPDFKDVNKDIVALLSVSKELYCKRYTSHYGDNLLSVSEVSPDSLGELQFKDLGK